MLVRVSIREGDNTERVAFSCDTTAADGEREIANHIAQAMEDTTVEHIVITRIEP